jgi:PIN domain nuclease of toxin-antitoxin system
MILLDTHVWIWWAGGDNRLSETQAAVITEAEADEIGVSIISCWEVAKLVEYGRLSLDLPVSEWLSGALGYPGVILLPISPDIVVESTELPGNFHRDPVDQMIVATARIYQVPLLTSDDKIIHYPYVATIH